jgi:flagellin
LLSVNTNQPALQALESLNQGADQLAQTENRTSTGLAVATPKDDGATWAIAQNIRSQISGWQAVSQSLSRGQSITDVAATGAATISDLLNQLKVQAVAYSDTSLDAASQAAIKADMSSIVNQINQTANGASFDGENLLTGGAINLNPPPMYPAPAGDQHVDWTPTQTLGAGTYNFTFDAPAGSYYGFDVQAPGTANLEFTSHSQSGPTLTAHADGQATTMGAWCPLNAQLVSATFTPDATPPIQILSDPSGGQITLSQYDLTATGLSLNNLDFSAPTTMISTINTAIETANSAAGQIGSQQNSLTTTQTQAQNTQDVLTTGVGNLVDANMAKESASLLAEQTKQQLATQALGIANAAPQLLLQLFR